MKTTFTIIVLTFCTISFQMQAQTASFANIIKQENYLKNPRAYLSDLDTNKIQEDILIDRTLHKGNVLRSNGSDKVTVFDYGDFYDVYQTVKFGNQDSSKLLPFDDLRSLTISHYQQHNINLITILDFNFNQIDSLALDAGDFVQNQDQLLEKNTSSDSYLNSRVVAFSCFKYNVYGNRIKFLIPEGFLVGNQDSLEVVQLEVDFDNGEGYKPVSFDEPVEVDYNKGSGYLEMKIKVSYTNKYTFEESKVYAHSSIYRKSLTVPSNSGSQIEHLTDGDIDYEATILKSFIYPEEVTGTRWESRCLSVFGNECIPYFVNVPYTEYQPYSFDVTILFNQKNKSGKLRRSIIVVDGFDEGNKRNFYETVKDNPAEKLLPKEKDYRGLFEVFDGQVSPWDILNFLDATKTDYRSDSHLVKAMQDLGFDIVFVNFMEGAGDINENAKQLRSFLNESINSALFRDNKTEEFVVVGPSMGGVITRMALAEMEQVKEEHYVKSWVSFDSPHTGANIPISLQFAMSEMASSDASAINEVPKQKMRAINSTAARQLFKQHWESSSSSSLNPDSLHDQLIKKLNNLGYPKMSKNYAITNGAKQLLYDNEVTELGKVNIDAQIVEGLFELGAVQLKLNSQFSPVIMESNIYGRGERQVLSSAKRLKIENTPGGWHGGLYSINRTKGNSFLTYALMQGVQYNKAAFVPTTSAFGIELNPTTMQNDWGSYCSLSDNYDGSKLITPFDVIYGMSGENQEHLAITESTRDKVVSWFKEDLKRSAKPFLRNDAMGVWSFANESVHQTASKPVAYVVEEAISFGGNGNTFAFKDGADANIVSGQTIEFLPGFSSEEGAIVVARIEEIEKGAVLKRGHSLHNSTMSEKVTPLKESEYLSLVYDYSQKEQLKSSEEVSFDLIPNPISSFLRIDFHTNSIGKKTVEVRDVSGKMVFQDDFFNSNIVKVNFSDFEDGAYIVTVIVDGNASHKKVVKI